VKRRLRDSADLAMGFNDLEWAHHLVVFVLEEVAVPDVAAGVALEGNDDSGDLSGFAANGVLPAGFGRRWYGGGGVAELAFVLIEEDVEAAAVEDQLPDLGGVDDGFSVTSICHGVLLRNMPIDCWTLSMFSSRVRRRVLIA
jgi:hypothetical protein